MRTQALCYNRFPYSLNSILGELTVTRWDLSWTGNHELICCSHTACVYLELASRSCRQWGGSEDSLGSAGIWSFPPQLYSPCIPLLKAHAYNLSLKIWVERGMEEITLFKKKSLSACPCVIVHFASMWVLRFHSSFVADSSLYLPPPHHKRSPCDTPLQAWLWQYRLFFLSLCTVYWQSIGQRWEKAEEKLYPCSLQKLALQGKGFFWLLGFSFWEYFTVPHERDCR